MAKSAVKLIQTLLVIAMVLAALRLATDMLQRWHTSAQPKAAAPATLPLPEEYYVVPKKLYPYDLKSARQLTRQPVWVREGYRYTVFPYDKSTARADFVHDAGTLGPIEKLQITAITTQPTPDTPGQRQVLALFRREGKSYAVPVGVEKGGDYLIYADEMFFYQDPRQLYNFWPQPVWDAIARHELTLGMNEYQADFAVGMGVPQPGDSSESKVVHYPNGGKPLVVTYRNGRAVDIRPGGRP